MEFKPDLKTTDSFHPLDPLSKIEIEEASAFAIHHLLQELKQKSVIITAATLIEPPKQDVLDYITSFSHPRSRPPRLCEVSAISIGSGENYVLKIEFPNQDPSKPIMRASVEILPEGTHHLISPQEVDLAEMIVREDKHIQKLCEDVGVSIDQIAGDGWAIGFDPDLTPTPHARLEQVLMYARPEPHGNLYAHPLDFVPVVDVLTRKVVRIDFPAHRLKSHLEAQEHDPINGIHLENNINVISNSSLSSKTTAPLHLLTGSKVKEAIENGLELSTIEEAFKASGRDRIKPPLTRFEFLPDLRSKIMERSDDVVDLPSNSRCGCNDSPNEHVETNGIISLTNQHDDTNGVSLNNGNDEAETAKANPSASGYQSRPPLRPLHVIQPEGPSFNLSGHQLEWQNWKMHIGFNYREGLVLNTISYRDEGVYRPLFYRLSLVEMVVPYGAPEAPHNSKFAFDVGEYGLGNLTNSLSLGCDCLGEIRYLDAINVSHTGKALVVKNAICIHEEDSGLLWKHTDLRAGGRSVSVRSRKLVISFICTIANYDYMFYWNFFQDGTISLDTKLTGILNLHVMAEDEHPEGFGTEVAPRIIAQHHSHTFSLRIDPMIDGLMNSVVRTEILALPNPTGSLENYLGNGFRAEKTVLRTTSEGAQDYQHDRDTSWTITNPNKLHYATKEPVGYQIACKDLPKMIAKSDSMIARRAPFAKHDLFVTPYVPHQYYPSGKFVVGTTHAPEDSIENWIKGEKKIDNEDIVVYLTFGTNHIPRPEQFPIMSAEVLTVSLRPSGFFKTNPSLDVPQVKDAKSRGARQNGHVTQNRESF